MGMYQAMPGGFVGDGGNNSAVQDAVAVQKFSAERKIYGDSVAMFSHHAQGEAVLEGHAGMIAEQLAGENAGPTSPGNNAA